MSTQPEDADAPERCQRALAEWEQHGRNPCSGGRRNAVRDAARKSPQPFEAIPEARKGEHPRLDALLHVWAIYQRTGGTRELGMRTSKFWAHGNSDFDTMLDAADTREAEYVDACVWDLLPLERAAVMNKQLQCVWRSNREDLEMVYGRARQRLSQALLRRRVP